MVPQPRARPAYVLPSDMSFTPSINGRNGWDSESFYEIDAEVGQKMYRSLAHRSDIVQHHADEICFLALKQLGRGAFGAVYRATHRMAPNAATWKNVAIKQTRPNLLDLRNGRVIQSYDDLERYCEEIKILIHLRQRSSRTSNVLHLYEYYLDGSDVFVITELLGQDLDIWRQECEVFTERMAIDISRSILRSLQYISERNVVHRDIKLQNILFRSTTDFKSLKLVDFGLSRILAENEQVRDFCGSVGYIAPEIYSGKSYRFEVDMFAFGVLLFRLLSAERPFPNANSQILRRHTLEYRYNVIGSAWENVSDTAKDLVRKLLINRNERLTAEEALRHPWFLTQGESILRSEVGRSCDRSEGFVLVRQIDISCVCMLFFCSVSKKSNIMFFLQSEEPRYEQSLNPNESGKYWIEASVQMALTTLISLEIYHAKAINHSESSDGAIQGLIQVEEIKSPIVSPVAMYVANIEKYNEKECRAICREIATCIKIMHDAGIAHRNLHVANVEINPFVSTIDAFTLLQRCMNSAANTQHIIFKMIYREKLVSKD
jgi:serine/threonine protein kinase